MQSATTEPKETTTPEAGAEQSPPAAPTVKQHTELKLVKHVFTQDERNEIGGTLGKDGAKGFEEGIKNIIEQNKEREE